MNELKKYFEENRNIFDNEEPLNGHVERFEKRLNNLVTEKKRKQTLTVRFISTFSIAASIALMFAAGIIWMLVSPQKEIEQNINEFTETEMFYREQMNGQISEILCKLDKADADTRNWLEKDLRSLTEDNNSFVEEIKEHGNEELAIYYLVEHYKANLQTLQLINTQLGEYFNC
jgi:hypothetical protein